MAAMSILAGKTAAKAVSNEQNGIHGDGWVDRQQVQAATRAGDPRIAHQARVSAWLSCGAHILAWQHRKTSSYGKTFGCGGPLMGRHFPGF